jgi:predicted DsbA family dithiol-disulfide isomerase
LHASTWLSMNGYLLVISRLIPFALSPVEGWTEFFNSLLNLERFELLAKETTMSEPLVLEVFSDFVWPWCYLVTGRVEKLKAKYDLEVKFTQFPLHPETPEEGTMRGPEVVARNRKMKVNMDREGLPYNAERNMSYNSRLAQELSKWAEGKDKADEIHDALFRAYFVDVKNIGKVEPLVEIAQGVGLPADEATDVLLSRTFKEAVDEDWRRCAAIGVNAVPTFLAGKYLMVGAQPYEELERLVQHVTAADSSGAS